MNLRDSMGILLAGALLLVICLAGVAWIALNRDFLTVDGLFMALILLTIAGAISFELLLELRRKDTAEASAAPAQRGAAAAATSAPGTISESGIVEKVEFYEAPVGEHNKTVVALKDGAGKPQRWITFEGNVQHLLQEGRRVRLVYRPAGAVNVLVGTEKS